MIHVILLDTGICLELCKDVDHIQQFSVVISHNTVSIKKKMSCTDMHGSYMLNTIKKYCKNEDVLYTMINVMNENNLSNSAIILEVIKFIYQSLNADYLLIGISFSSSKYINEISYYASKLRKRGMALIAPVSHLNGHLYPFSLSPFTAIYPGLFYENDTYYDPIKKCIIGNVMPEFIPMENKRYQLFSGTSLASARYLAGLIAQDSENSKIQIYKQNLSIEISDLHSKKYDKKNYDKIKNKILSKCDITVESKRALACYEDIDLLLLYRPLKDFDIFLSDTLGDCIDLAELNYSNFISMYNLSMLMQKIV